jgi:hypothetical protein
LKYRFVTTVGVQMIFIGIVSRVDELEELCEDLRVLFAEVDMAREGFLWSLDQSSDAGRRRLGKKKRRWQQKDLR